MNKSKSLLLELRQGYETAIQPLKQLSCKINMRSETIFTSPTKEQIKVVKSKKYEYKIIHLPGYAIRCDTYILKPSGKKLAYVDIHKRDRKIRYTNLSEVQEDPSIGSSGLIKKAQLYPFFGRSKWGISLVIMKEQSFVSGLIDLLTGELGSFSLKEIDWEGKKVILLEKKDGEVIDVKCWFDPSKGFLPLRMEKYNFAGHLIRSADFSNFFNIPEVGWICKKGISKEIRGNPYGGEYPMATAIFEIIDIKFNVSLKEGDFDFCFPPRTSVLDKIKGVHYFVEEDGTLIYSPQ